MTSKKLLVVTIDGPAGAGKSTVARALADRLSYVYLDTGAIYRCVALAAQRKGLAWCDEALVAAEAESLATGGKLRFERNADGTQRVFMDSEDVSQAIRTPEISAGASTVSAHPKVRAALLDLQRNISSRGGVVMEGRDTGSVVYPQADAKFFMSATAQERAKRRFDELTAKGMVVDYDATLKEIIERDRRDSERAVAPLIRPQNAIDVETTGVPVEDVIEKMARHVESLL